MRLSTGTKIRSSALKENFLCTVADLCLFAPILLFGVNGFVVHQNSLSKKSRSPCSTGGSRRWSTIGFETTTSTNNSQALQDCVCLVTGGSRGIGKAIAGELGKAGAIVYITGTSTSSSSKQASSSGGPYTTNSVVGGPGTIEETAALVTVSGGTGIPVYCDHGNDKDVLALFERISKEQGRIDVLVNNAFRIPPGGVEELKSGKFWETDTRGSWDAMHTIGLRSHYVSSMYAIPLMIKARQNPKGKLPRPFIAMISSFGGVSYTFSVAYGVAKAGVDRLARDMAVELKDEDICVVSFWPGLVYTERTQIAVENGEWEKYIGLSLRESESPAFTGRAIKAVALDSANMEKSGTYQVVAELAQEYSFTDVNGKRPPSIRSLKFLLPNYAWDASTRERVPDWMIPDLKLPFWMMSQPPPSD